MLPFILVESPLRRLVGFVVVVALVGLVFRTNSLLLVTAAKPRLAIHVASVHLRP